MAVNREEDGFVEIDQPGMRLSSRRLVTRETLNNIPSN
jgi:hypothetical protein